MATSGEKIERIRMAREWSRTELARRAGVHEDDLARIENGGRRPSASTLSAIAKALGVSFAGLLSD